MIERNHHPRMMRLPKLITDPEGPISQARLLQLFRRALHDREAVSGDPLWGFPYSRELFLERHLSFSPSDSLAHSLRIESRDPWHPGLTG